MYIFFVFLSSRARNCRFCSALQMRFYIILILNWNNRHKEWKIIIHYIKNRKINLKNQQMARERLTKITKINKKISLLWKSLFINHMYRYTIKKKMIGLNKYKYRAYSGALQWKIVLIFSVKNMLKLLNTFENVYLKCTMQEFPHFQISKYVTE